LWRYNPELEKEGKNPFTLDSKEPNWDDFSDFLKGEVRYASVNKQYPDEADELFECRSRKCTMALQQLLKGPSNASGTTRFEWEKEISTDDVQQLLQVCEPGIIDKTRYLVKAEPYTFEVDEFYGDNEGLVVAEIELPDENAPFTHPSWLGKEVTGDRRYYNSMLAKHPYKDW
jgi:CYTH domain-containing protein